jgi:hypothetical protein
MFDCFGFGKYPSHYEEKAEGPKITIIKRVLSTNEKVVEACKNLDDYAREYTPAAELTPEQKAEIEHGKVERENYRALFDLGYVMPRANPVTFRIVEK